MFQVKNLYYLYFIFLKYFYLLLDPQWSLERRALNSSFGNKILNNFMPLFNDQAQKLVEQLRFHLDGEAINMVSILQTCTLKMATSKLKI